MNNLYTYERHFVNFFRVVDRLEELHVFVLNVVVVEIQTCNIWNTPIDGHCNVQLVTCNAPVICIPAP